MNPNKLDVQFWKGESLEDHGFVFHPDAVGSNGNMPTLYATGPDGIEWEFAPCFHCWIEVK